jgi:carboxymethylenebutenolidase
MSVIRSTAALGTLAVLFTGCHRPISSEDHSSHMAATASGTVAGQGAVGLPASNGSAAARLASSPRKGEWIKVPFNPGSRDTIMAWIVYPANTSAKAPVVIVVHDIAGLSAWARGVADQAAAEGFIAISPDFASRARGAPSTAELAGDSARKVVGSLPSDERNKVISTVASYAMRLPNAAAKYGVIGYCWGGSTVFMHAVNGGVAGFGGGVGFYGLPYMDGQVPSRDSLAKIKMPVMLFSGAKDARIGAAMPVVDSMMKALGKNYQSKNFEGATHGFMRSQDDPKATRDLAEEAANLAATKEAWPRTVEFLKRQLR